MSSWTDSVIWWQVYPLGFVGAEQSALPSGSAVEHRLPQLLPWLDYLVELGCNGLALNPVQVVPITTDQYATPARRPRYSILSNSLLKKTFGIEMRDWRAQLHDAFREEPLVREKHSYHV